VTGLVGRTLEITGSDRRPGVIRTQGQTGPRRYWWRATSARPSRQYVAGWTWGRQVGPRSRRCLSAR